MEGDNPIEDIIKASAIIFALVHFIAGFVMYRDILRINRVVQTNLRSSIKLISNLYIVILLAITIIFIVI